MPGKPPIPVTAIGINPTAFDAFAAAYDDDFTQSTLGRLLRPRVWQILRTYFAPGQHLLELTCGTGEDAVHLARQGLHVTATDGSAEMVRLTQAKVEQAGLEDRVAVAHLSLQDITSSPGRVWEQEPTRSASEPFDGAYTNFGGLNTIGDWHPLAQALARLIRPGGYLVLVPMGPVCPWEIGWYAAHSQLKNAVRRFNQPASATIGDLTIPIWYPTARRLRADFGPWFTAVRVESLGLWLPPSYLDHLVERWPQLFTWLNEWEKRTASLTKSWGDHYFIVLKRLPLLKTE